MIDDQKAEVLFSTFVLKLLQDAGPDAAEQFIENQGFSDHRDKLKLRLKYMRIVDLLKNLSDRGLKTADAIPPACQKCDSTDLEVHEPDPVPVGYQVTGSGRWGKCKACGASGPIDPSGLSMFLLWTETPDGGKSGV